MLKEACHSELVEERHAFHQIVYPSTS